MIRPEWCMDTEKEALYTLSYEMMKDRLKLFLNLKRCVKMTHCFSVIRLMFFVFSEMLHYVYK